MATAGWPSGTVAFLFTDVEGGTGLWERFPDRMPAASARHDALLRAAADRHGGVVYKVIGDAFQIAFPDAPAALAGTLDAQRALIAEAWPLPEPLRVRMALHACAATPTADGDYRTPGLNRLGRLLAAGHGGQILCSEAVVAGCGPPPGSAFHDLGERRLKDLPGAERIYRLAATGLPDDFPPLATLDPRPHDLPAPPSPLIGREPEVTAVCALLRDERARLVTLTGMGGVGKTRLAAAAASRLVDSVGDGVRWLPLAPLTDPALIAAVAAERLGLREAPGRTMAEVVTDWLRERAILLVLDNCEQISGGVAATIAAWLDAAPGLQVLATSRTPLRLGAERIVTVAPLSVPDARVAALDALGAAPAGAMMLDRAGAIDAGIVDADAGALARVCRLVDGLPLAIELAAARLDRFPANELAERLADRLGVLADGPRDLPARQQTLRSTIAWSHDLLNGEQQALFRTLSAFSGGATVEAIEAVGRDRIEGTIGGEAAGTRALIAELGDHSLIRLDAATHSLPARITMLETVRAYGAERLAASGEEAATRAAHLGHYLAVAVADAAQPLGADQAQRYDRLAADDANFRAALGWGSDAGRDDDAVLRLATALTPYWRTRGHLSEGAGWMQRALEAAGEGDPQRRAAALDALGNLVADRGDYRHARACFTESIAIWRAMDDQRGVANARDFLGVIAMDQGDFQEAETHLRDGLAIRRTIDDPFRQAVTLSNLGAVSMNQGRFDDAVAFLTEARTLYRASGDTLRIAYALNLLGIVSRRRGDPAGAEGFYTEALALYRTLGYSQGIGGVLNNLGMIAFARGDHAAAAASYDEALRVWTELGDTPGRARTLSNLAAVRAESGDTGHALGLYRESLELRRGFGDQPGIIDCLVGIAALLARERGDGAAGAARLLGAAEALRLRIGLAIPPSEQAAHDDRIAAVRASLGPASFEAEWSAGAAMGIERAIEEALSADG